MKKSAFLITGLLILNQSFADIGATNGAANDATCDTNVLGSDSGSVELTPTWSANNIGLKWTVPQNEGISGGTGGATSCTYGQTINLPSNPTKRGYVFTGWRLRPKYDFSTLDSTSTRLHFWGKGHALNDSNIDTCWYDQGDTTVLCDSSFNDLTQMKWKVEFSWGIVYGDALCSATYGKFWTKGTPDETTQNGRYCWCRVSMYKSIGVDNNVYVPSTSLSWVKTASMDSSNALWCPNVCPLDCANYVGINQYYTGKLFGQ